MENKPPPFFQTANCQLASALALAGIPWLDPNEPLQTEYDADYLAANGCQTIAEARAKKKPGRYGYQFKPVAELKECIAQFDQTKAEIAAALENGADIPLLEQLSPRARVEIITTILALDAAVRDARFKVPAWLCFQKDGEEETVKNEDGSTTVRYPGFTRFRSDAPAHIKEKLKQ